MPQQEYELPRDSTESARLTSQHGIYVQNLGYVLHPTIAASAPPNARVADIGTGTGAWALDLASSKPGYIFEGFDISDAQFPKTHPQNVSFRLLNILEPVPEELKGVFDIVQMRLLVCGLAGNEWQTVASHALEMLKPGGWIQWCESDFDHIEVLKAEPGAERTATVAMKNAFIEGLHKVGKLQQDARNLAETVGGAGFEQVREDAVSSERVEGLRGVVSEIGIGALAGIVRTLVKAGVLGEGMDVDELEGRCREEMREGRVYWRWTIHCVVGRKPLN